MRVNDFIHIISLTLIISSSALAVQTPPADPPPQNDVAIVPDDAFRAMTREQQLAYIQAQRAAIALHAGRLNQVNNINFDADLDAVASDRWWAALCNRIWHLLSAAQGATQVITPALALYGITGAFQPWLGFVLAGVTGVAWWFGNRADTLTTRANEELRQAEAIDAAEAADLARKITIFNNNEQIQNAVDAMMTAVLVNGPANRDAALALIRDAVHGILHPQQMARVVPPQPVEVARAVPLVPPPAVVGPNPQRQRGRWVKRARPRDERVAPAPNAQHADLVEVVVDAGMRAPNATDTGLPPANNNANAGLAALAATHTQVEEL